LKINSEGGQELQAGNISFSKKGVMVAFEDETWTELCPRVDAKWMRKGRQERIATPLQQEGERLRDALLA